MKRDFEIVVVGAGPAGIAAACAAAERGKRVAIIDDNFAPGGQIWRGERARQKNRNAHSYSFWFHKLDSSASIARLFGYRIFDHCAERVLCAEQDEQLVELKYNRLIVATGAREFFLPFPGWTLPNVMGAGALQAMVKSGLPIRDKRVVVAGTGPLLLAVAVCLRDHGARVAAICEQTGWSNLARFAVGMARESTKLRQGLRYGWKTLGIPFCAGCWPVAAGGNGELQSVIMTNGATQWEVPCDYLACGFHLVPNIELPRLLDCSIEDGAVVVDPLQRTSVENVFCAGEPTGIGGVELSLLEGRIAGLACAGDDFGARVLARRRTKMVRFAKLLATAFQLRPELRRMVQPDTIVCRCEDVRYESIRQHNSWRAAKLHTRCGMGPCQGRICGSALEFLAGWNADSVRPPIFPVQMASLGGWDERPARCAAKDCST